MIDGEKLAAFALVTATTSVVPGPSMLFIMGQAIQRGTRSGAAALAGVELGYILWWLLAALGLGTLAAAFPLAFHMLAIAGAAYLGWLGLRVLTNAGEVAEGDSHGGGRRSRTAFRDGVLVALGNPKALIYIVALLPPFIDQTSAIGPQLLLLAAIGMSLDIALGALYIATGNRLARAMARPDMRLWLDRSVGAIYVLIAVAILADLLLAS